MDLPANAFESRSAISTIQSLSTINPDATLESVDTIAKMMTRIWPASIPLPSHIFKRKSSKYRSTHRMVAQKATAEFWITSAVFAALRWFFFYVALVCCCYSKEGWFVNVQYLLILEWCQPIVRQVRRIWWQRTKREIQRLQQASKNCRRVWSCTSPTQIATSCHPR